MTPPAVDTPVGRDDEGFRLFANGTSDYAIIMLDATGRVISWNAGAEKMKGYAAGEIMGQSFSRFYPPDAIEHGGPDLELEVARIEGSFEDEGWRVRKDGSRFWANVVMTTLRDELGELRGFSQITRDLTERKGHEEALHLSGERFRLLVESVKDYAIFMLDPDGRVASWNAGAQRIKGYLADEIIGQHFSRFYPREARERGWPEFELEVAKSEGRFEDEGWRLRKDGSQFWANVVITPLRHKDGSLIGFAKVVRDMTERKRIEELKNGERQMNEFLAMLAHELRNPLAPICNAVSVMQIKGTDDPALLWCHDVVHRQVNHLSRLIDDLLDLGRIRCGRIVLKRQLVDLAAVVSNTVEASRALVQQREHELSVSLPEEPLWIHADLTRISQVAWNLLDNAAKYTPERGRIWVSVERAPGLAVIRVRDDGIGIQADLLPRVFELFTQGERTLDRAEGGLGIGLTLVRRLVELHGGTVTASSAGQGRGSEFVVRLPSFSAGSNRSQSREQESLRAAMIGAPRRVLIVDDNKDVAESLAMLARLGGHDVRTAYDGPQGLALAEEILPDVVFLDLGLPGMNGYEIARRIREIPSLHRVKLIAVTGYGSDEDRRRSAEAGFVAHLEKPVDPLVLSRVLKDHGS